MTNQTIILNYQNAIRQAEALEEEASSLRDLGNKQLDGTLQEISAAWTGENSREFLRRGSDMKEKIRRTADNIDSIADEIRRKAARIKAAEEEALRIAEERRAREAAESARAAAASVGAAVSAIIGNN